MAANRSMYKKSALTLMHMARDLFLTEEGEKIPTINEYTEKFDVSRGIVQQALEILTEDGSIQMEKRGVRGSYLIKADYDKLYSHTGWGSITGTMPIPLTPYFTSLATALCEVLSRGQTAFSFAYMSGSAKRAEALKNGVYDFMIVSKSAAMAHMNEYDDLAVCAELRGAMYSREYKVYFTDSSKKKIEDGMRIGVDPVCMDQRRLTEMLCEGKAVEIVEFPFIGFEDIMKSGKVDCAIFRDISWSDEARSLDLGEVPVTGIDGYLPEDMNTPVVIVRKDNYGIDKLINKYLNSKEIAEIQQEVLEGKRTMKFY